MPNPDGKDRAAIRWLAPAVLVVVAVWLHWPSRSVFKCDDYAILNYVMDWRNCLGDFVGPQYDLNFFKFYRPFITLSFGVDYRLHGTEPFGYYATSVIALAAGAVLLVAILRALTVARPAAFAAGVLWVCHPTVVISQRCWAAGRVDTHVVLPILLTLYSHLRQRRGGPRWPVWLAAVWALGTKEYAIGLPFMLLGLDLLDTVPDRRASRLPAAWPYLLLIPGFFLFRYLVLGEFVGGYVTAKDAPLDPAGALEGAWTVLTSSFLPGAGAALAFAATGILFAVAGWRLLRAAGHRAVRIAGIALVGAGLFLGLAQLLPAMTTFVDQRWAYFICSSVMVIWAVTVGDLAKRAGGWTLPVALLPLLWLLPARAEQDATMDHHDRFVASVVEAMRECDALLPPGEPVVLAGDAEMLMHPYRFTWGLANVLGPPHHPRFRHVVALSEFVTGTHVPDAALVCAGLPAWLEVHGDGARLVRGSAAPRGLASPVGFDGMLTGTLVDRLVVGDDVGFAVGAGFDGRVAVCTSRGSAVALAPAKGGVVRLREILTADVSTQPGSPRPLASYAWVPADMDGHNPILLCWQEANGLRVARLEVGEGFVERFLELAEAAQTGREIRPR